VIILQTINSILKHKLVHNPHFTYQLLHQHEVFESFHVAHNQNPRFRNLLLNVLSVQFLSLKYVMLYVFVPIVTIFWIFGRWFHILLMFSSKLNTLFNLVILCRKHEVLLVDFYVSVDLLSSLTNRISLVSDSCSGLDINSSARDNKECFSALESGYSHCMLFSHNQFQDFFHWKWCPSLSSCCRHSLIYNSNTKRTILLIFLLPTFGVSFTISNTYFILIIKKLFCFRQRVVDFLVCKNQWMKMKMSWMKNRQITNKNQKLSHTHTERETSFHFVCVLSFLESNFICF
jgi:hypothetical protein